jgi:uncharacterized protein
LLYAPGAKQQMLINAMGNKMKQYEKVTSLEIFMGKLSCGGDLLQELTDLCIERNIVLGRIEAIGAVQKARIGFYNQENKTYEFTSFDRAMEINNLTGNISLKDGKPFVHAHVTLTDEKDVTIGGHLAEGTIVFACEFVLEVFTGSGFDRVFDKETGLTLWSMRK